MTPAAFHAMRLNLEEREKRALAAPMQPQQPGKMEKYLPWYGAAGAGAVGHELGKKLMPAKYKALGAIGGTLLGTGLGVHSGEALGKRLDARSRAVEKRAEAGGKPDHPAKTLAKSVLGFGAGMGAGYAGMKGVDAALRAVGKPGIPSGLAWTAIPVLTGAGGMAYGHMQRKTLDKMRQDYLTRQEQKRDSQSS